VRFALGQIDSRRLASFYDTNLLSRMQAREWRDGKAVHLVRHADNR
jgi:hypothetical protein